MEFNALIKETPAISPALFSPCEDTARSQCLCCSVKIGLRKGTGSQLQIGRIWKVSFQRWAERDKENKAGIENCSWTLDYSVLIDIDEPAI